MSVVIDGRDVAPGEAHLTIDGEEFWGRGSRAGIGGRFELGPEETIVRFDASTNDAAHR